MAEERERTVYVWGGKRSQASSLYYKKRRFEYERNVGHESTPSSSSLLGYRRDRYPPPLLRCCLQHLHHELVVKVVLEATTVAFAYETLAASGNTRTMTRAELDDF